MRHDEGVADWILQTINSNMKHSLKRHAIDRILRYVGSPNPNRVSVRAQEVGTALGIGKLCQYYWRDQNVKMKDKGRKIFHQEHVIPVGEIITRMFDCTSSKEIQHQMDSMVVAWILKAEDALLNEGIDGQSFRSKRPDNAYELLGIDLVGD